MAGHEPDKAAFKAKTAQLEQRFARHEARLKAFDGEKFSLIDAVFRYFDVFDEIAHFGILSGNPKLARWRESLAARPSVLMAVSADYPGLLRDFGERRGPRLGDRGDEVLLIARKTNFLNRFNKSTRRANHPKVRQAPLCSQYSDFQNPQIVVYPLHPVPTRRGVSRTSRT